MIYAGIDAGSRTVKAILLDGKELRVLASGIADQGIKQADLAESLLKDILKKAGINRKDVGKIIATGYGRNAIDFADTTITEITCHACGVHHWIPQARTVVDIGGQDSKVLRLEPDGGVRDFVMNDRCAAGTGRFLEVVAAKLEVSLNDLGGMAQRAKKASAISSMCVVFAETEIIGLLASGETPENIVAGVQMSITSRITSMAGRNITDPVVFTGGVALIPGMDKALESAINHKIIISPEPQMTGALGAAILAGREGLEHVSIIG
ncbi:MAG: acyl-CoA dehydratase activase [Kiritimatiellae bacterium]|nr:acyl-CoA dehydratase activase [Kiritimatiellia bacterium]MDD5520948.1 acyl-CoA dehydratase activase [Kiritimatiellia bacterium]